MKIILCILFGLILFTICLISEANKYNHKKHNCTLTIPGTIVNLIEEDNGIYEYDSIKVYRPVICYNYNGKEYTYYHTIAKTSYKQLPIGMNVIIKINPNNPQEAIFSI